MSFVSSKNIAKLIALVRKMIVLVSKTGVFMSLERYKTNPFLENMIVPVKGKQVQLSRLGRDENVLVNHKTGEIQGTHVTTVKRVDSEQFVKLFTANIALTFDLSSAGIKVFSVLLWAVQHKALAKDEVDMDPLLLDDFLVAHKDKEPPLQMSVATFKRGINELEKARIIAKTLRKGRYFINPNFVFNGDRVAFTTVIERSRGENEQVDEK